MTKNDPIKEYQLKSGEIRNKFDVYLGIDNITGKEVRKIRPGFFTRKEAKVEISRLKVKFEDNEPIINNRPRRIKFEYVYNLWLSQYENTFEENTYSIEKRRADNHILPKFEGMYVDKIELAYCQKIVNKWYGYYKSASLLINIFNRIVKLASANNWIEKNPMRDVIRPNKQTKEKYKAPYYEKTELVKFLTHVTETKDLELMATFRLLAYSGLRKGELHGLQWSDINFSKQTLSVDRVLSRGKKISTTLSYRKQKVVFALYL